MDQNNVEKFVSYLFNKMRGKIDIPDAINFVAINFDKLEKHILPEIINEIMQSDDKNKIDYKKMMKSIINLNVTKFIIIANKFRQ